MAVAISTAGPYYVSGEIKFSDLRKDLLILVSELMKSVIMVEISQNPDSPAALPNVCQREI